MIPLVPVLAVGSLGALIWYAVSGEDPAKDHEDGTQGSLATAPKASSHPQRRSWLDHPDVNGIFDMGDHVLVVTTSGSTPEGLPLASTDGRPVYVNKGGPFKPETLPKGSKIISPYVQVVNQVVGELETRFNGHVEIKHGFNLFKQRTETIISAPAPLVEAVREVVARAMKRYERDPHTRVEERKASPGAVGEGWQIVLIETKGSGPPHAH